MSKVIVFCELQLKSDGASATSKSSLSESSLCAITAAKEYSKLNANGEVHLLLVGKNAEQVAGELAGVAVDSILWFDDPALSSYRSVPYSTVVSGALKTIGADILFLAATSIGKDLAPCVAALIEAGQASDVIEINSDGTFKRPMYAGDILADVEITTNKGVVTVRASAFDPISTKGGSPQVKKLEGVGGIPDIGEVVSYELSKSERPELSSASIVVSGGRALGSAENFEKVLYPLADSLGAAVGASRAAVDSGYAPNDWQVGQTGKVVAPSLYISLGISGAIQHLAGMKDSKVIVAINKDPDAPIFDVATYGLVGDLFEIAPTLTQLINQLKS